MARSLTSLKFLAANLLCHANCNLPAFTSLLCILNG